MNLLLILTIVVAMSSQGIAQKQYNSKTENNGAFIFSSISMISPQVLNNGSGFSKVSDATWSDGCLLPSDPHPHFLSIMCLSLGNTG